MNDSATQPSPNERCATCGISFRCGRNDQEPCWCARDFPAVMPLPVAGTTAGCLCPDCLRKEVERQQDSPSG